MHPLVYKRFGEICAARGAGGDVLEIGAVPSEESLLCLPALRTARTKIGLNLEGASKFRDFATVQGNANAMTFPDASFDSILCNATLEHDPFFWKTLTEIRRVARKGALVVIGVPGYTKLDLDAAKDRWERIPFVSRWVRRHLGELTASTLTLQVHNFPGDYYRFSPQAMREVFFENFREVEVETLMVPPRIIGSGIW